MEGLARSPVTAESMMRAAPDPVPVDGAVALPEGMGAPEGAAEETGAGMVAVAS